MYYSYDHMLTYACHHIGLLRVSGRCSRHLITYTNATSCSKPRLEFSSSTGRFFVRTEVKPTVSVYWNRVVQNIVSQRKPGPVEASGAYVIMHTSIFEAWRQTKHKIIYRKCSFKLLAMHYAARNALLRSFPKDRKAILHAVRTARVRCK